MSSEPTRIDSPTLLSSPLTLLLKWLVPVAFVAIAALTSFAVIISAPDDHSIRVFPVLIALGCAAYAIFSVFEACTVMDSVTCHSSTLIIRRNKTEDTIPIANIEQIKDNTFRRPETITLNLKSPSRFGTKVFFYAPLSFNPFGTHPVASALKIRLEAIRSMQNS